MNLIIFGPPGSGKGTQAKKISKHFTIPHISTGDMLREEIEEKSSLGKMASNFISKGDLVPDALVIKILKKRIEKGDCKSGFILDGFPRNLTQQKVLTSLLEEMGRPIDRVINLIVSEETIKKRILGRRVCSNCKRNYNIYQPNWNMCTKLCPICSGELMIRDDDNIETVRNRLNVYRKHTESSLKPYYKDNLVIEIDGENSLDVVFKDIKRILEDIFDKDKISC